jgi:hypothetical protein
MNSSSNRSLADFFSLPFFHYRSQLYVFHTIILDLGTIIIFSIIKKWYDDLRQSYEFYSMYGTDADSECDSEPDLLIMGLLEEHQSNPVTMREVPFFGWYSVALTQFRVPWISARAPRGTTLYLHGVMYLTSVRRYSLWRWTLKRTCYIRHITSVLMLLMFLNVALSPWVLIISPISLRMNAEK